MHICENTLDRMAWNRLAASFVDFSLLQMWEYAEAKSVDGPWSVHRLMVKSGSVVVGLCQCRVRRIPLLGAGLVWVNRGPLWRTQEVGDSRNLLEILQALRRYWVDERNMYLRVAPPISGAERESVLSSPGFSPARPLGEWVSARLDLSLPLDALRANLDRKWRNCLRRAEQSGLRCQDGTDGTSLSQVLEEYSALRRRKELGSSADSGMLLRLQERLRSEDKLRAFVASDHGVPLGGIVIARYGLSCEYLVCAVSDKGKALNAGNLLLWSAVSRMKDLGVRWFDLGGMHPERTPAGIFHFKRGLGGQSYALMGSIDAHRGGLWDRLINWRLNRGRGDA